MMGLFQLAASIFGARSQERRGLYEKIRGLEQERAFLRDQRSNLQYENTELKAEIYRLSSSTEAQIASYERQNRHLLERAVRLSSFQPSPAFRLNGPCAVCEERRIADLNRHGEEKRDLEKSNDAQAARAMARNTKQAFQAYQSAVKHLLDELDTIGRKNVVTKEDMRKFREVRRQLGDAIHREI